MKNIRRTSEGREASEKLSRLKVVTRTQRLSKASQERSIGRREVPSGQPKTPGRLTRARRSVKAGASEVLTSSRPEHERSDMTNKVEAGAEFKARSAAAGALGKVPGAGTVVKTISPRADMSENVEAIGQRYAKEGASRAGLRTARVAGKASRRSAQAAGRGAKSASKLTLTATRRSGAAAGRAAQQVARAAVKSAQLSVALIRAAVSVVAGAVTSVPVLAVLGVAIAIVAVLASIISAIFPTITNTSSCTAEAGADTVSSAYGGYGSPEQKKNAQEIIRAGKSAGLETRDITIGVMTAIGESGLRILAYGDTAGPDSRGLFQQRDSWGPLSVRMNAFGSAGLFFDSLKKVPDREALEPTLVANKVQINADRNHYAKFWTPAVSVVSSLGGGTASACLPGGAGVAGDSGKDDDYPFKSGIYNASNPVTGFALKNCTDFAWWRMMQQLGITDQDKMDARRLGPGNGATWGDAWKRVGWEVTMTPTVGAVIWYGTGNPGGDPTYGHVAVVKSISADGQVLEEGYNMGPDKLGQYYTRTVAPDSPSGYLIIPTKEQFSQAS